MTTDDNSRDTFGTRTTLPVGGEVYTIFSLPALDRAGISGAAHLPATLRILLENLLRLEDGRAVTRGDIEALLSWSPERRPTREIAFTPARVLLQDFTGVPAVVDLAAMRDAMARMGGDPSRINPLRPADLVIDHSVQVDVFGRASALRDNARIEFERNRERYSFLKWGQGAFRDFRVVPPDTGIVHQVNLEYLASVAFIQKGEHESLLYFDTLVGTDSHTTMINGLGVLGWGVGGIEAEAALLGQPISMLIPEVVGFRLSGQLPAGATATDLVLTVTEMLRKKGVVGKFVEFYGPGIASLPAADRATISNMAPEYGATVGFFPVDEETLRYLRLTGRTQRQVALVEAYHKAQGLFGATDHPASIYSASLELDLARVEPSLAGPKRPQDRVPLSCAKQEFRRALTRLVENRTADVDPKRIERWIDEGGNDDRIPGELTRPEDLGHLGAKSAVEADGQKFDLRHGSVVIAAITSCTNTSNPSVMVAAGLLAKKAADRGLKARPWVKTSLAPGSKVVTEYLQESGLLSALEQTGFYLVGYGCTTCIGNSGPLPEAIGKAVKDQDLVAAAVLSGNRNFEGRINPLVRANYLASPPLVVAYALAGDMDRDFAREPVGLDRAGKPVYLSEIWPSPSEVRDVIAKNVHAAQFHKSYGEVFSGDVEWRGLPVPKGSRYEWSDDSTYIKQPPYFEDLSREPAPLTDIRSARALAWLGDSVTTDHISPAGSIGPDTPAGRYLIERGVAPRDFNSYGSRRGNHEVMIRGTFANIRLRNRLAPGTEGGWTTHFPDGKTMTIFDAASLYQSENVPLIVLAGQEYGTGSSRDWAAKGTRLLGVRAVIAQSFERIHRSNLIGMGVLPLEFAGGENAEKLGLSGGEQFDIEGLEERFAPGQTLRVRARAAGGGERRFEVKSRIDTVNEADYYRHGGILQYVLRQLLAG
jgi:aconitate hydratase A / 2-methylisocitrate dehydratase